MGFYSGPVVVTDSLIFCFDSGNVRCTDADDALASMRDVAPVAHSSRTDRSVHGDGNTAAFSFPTNPGAAKVINTGCTGRNQATDATNYENRIDLDEDINFSDQDAWSCEFWAKPNSGAEHTFLSLAGRGTTTMWFIWQHGSSTWYPRFRDYDGTYRRSAGNETDDSPDDWHQVVFTADASRNINFYVDGASIGSSVAASNSAVILNRICAGYSSGTARYGFQGNMLCARIYAKTLSAAEVKQNFEATRWRVGI